MRSLLLSIVAALCGMCTPSQSQSFDLNPTSTRALSRVKHVCTTAACGDISKPLSLSIHSFFKRTTSAPSSTVSIVETYTNTYDDLDDTKDVANLRAKCKSDVCEAAEECTLAPKLTLNEPSAATTEQSSISRSVFKTKSSTAVSQVADGGGFLTVSGRGKGRRTKTGTSGRKKKDGAKTAMNKNKKEKKNSVFGTVAQQMQLLDDDWEEGDPLPYTWNLKLTDHQNKRAARKHYARWHTPYCNTCGGAGKEHTKSNKQYCRECVKTKDEKAKAKSKKTKDEREALLSAEEIERRKKAKSVYGKSEKAKAKRKKTKDEREALLSAEEIEKAKAKRKKTKDEREALLSAEEIERRKKAKRVYGKSYDKVYRKNKRATDGSYKLKCLTRGRVCGAFARHVEREKTPLARRPPGWHDPVHDLLGLSTEETWKKLEEQFIGEMSIENHGRWSDDQDYRHWQVRDFYFYFSITNVRRCCEYAPYPSRPLRPTFFFFFFDTYFSLFFHRRKLCLD